LGHRGLRSKMQGLGKLIAPIYWQFVPGGALTEVFTFEAIKPQVCCGLQTVSLPAL
jgi:hypothetical protein